MLMAINRWFSPAYTGGRKALVLVSALPSFAGRWLQFSGHYPPDSRNLSRMATRRAYARLAFTPFAEVVEEYQQYRQSDAWQRDGSFWSEQRKQLPPPASLSNNPLPGRSASADIIRMKLTAPEGRFVGLRHVCLTFSVRIWPSRWWHCGWDVYAVEWIMPPGLSLCGAWGRRR